MNPIACLECRKLSPFTCVNHAPVARRPARWDPARPPLPPVPKSRAEAATLRANAVEQKHALCVNGFEPTELVSINAAIGFYDAILSSPAIARATDDGDHDVKEDPAS